MRDVQVRHICIIMLFCYRNKAHGELHQTDFMASWEGYGQVAKAEEDPYPNSRLLVAHRCVNTASWRAFRVWMLFQLSAKKPETFSPSSIITGISTMMHAFTDCEPQDVRYSTRYSILSLFPIHAFRFWRWLRSLWLFFRSATTDRCHLQGRV